MKHFYQIWYETAPTCIAATLSTLKGSLQHYPLPPAFTVRHHHHHHHHHRQHHLLSVEQATTVLPHYTLSVRPWHLFEELAAFRSFLWVDLACGVNRTFWGYQASFFHVQYYIKCNVQVSSACRTRNKWPRNLCRRCCAFTVSLSEEALSWCEGVLQRLTPCQLG